jgi:excisionase family DNA binding protein
MHPEKTFSVGEIATFCQVHRRTVLRWIHAGYLKAYTLPSGHFRIAFEKLEIFLRAHDMTDIQKKFSSFFHLVILETDQEKAQVLKSFLMDCDRDFKIDIFDDFPKACLSIGFKQPLCVFVGTDFYKKHQKNLEVFFRAQKKLWQMKKILLIESPFPGNLPDRMLIDTFLSWPYNFEDIQNIFRKIAV